MKTIYSELKTFCRDTFSSTDIGDAVFLFYKHHIIFTPSQKKQQGSLVKATKLHISNLLAEFNEDAIINVINHFLEKVNKGEIVEKTSEYIYACVKNNYVESNPVPVKKVLPKHIKKEKLIQRVVREEIKIVVPTIVRQVNKKIKEEQSIEEQFMYMCPICSNKIFGKLDTCSVCKSTLDYSPIDYSGANR
jgi:hypothetical protein